MADIEIITVAPQHCALVRGILHRATIGTEIRALFDRYYRAGGSIPGSFSTVEFGTYAVCVKTASDYANDILHLIL